MTRHGSIGVAPRMEGRSGYVGKGGKRGTGRSSQGAGGRRAWPTPGRVLLVMSTVPSEAGGDMMVRLTLISSTRRVIDG